MLAGSVPQGQTWVLGNEYGRQSATILDGNTTNRKDRIPDQYQAGRMYDIKRPAALMANGKYFTLPVPQYETFEAGQFINVKADPDFPVLGDSQSIAHCSLVLPRRKLIFHRRPQ